MNDLRQGEKNMIELLKRNVTTRLTPVVNALQRPITPQSA
jgi:hypothetical protein